MRPRVPRLSRPKINYLSRLGNHITRRSRFNRHHQKDYMISNLRRLRVSITQLQDSHSKRGVALCMELLRVARYRHFLDHPLNRLKTRGWIQSYKAVEVLGACQHIIREVPQAASQDKMGCNSDHQLLELVLKALVMVLVQQLKLGKTVIWARETTIQIRLVVAVRNNIVTEAKVSTREILPKRPRAMLMMVQTPRIVAQSIVELNLKIKETAHQDLKIEEVAPLS